MDIEKISSDLIPVQSSMSEVMQKMNEQVRENQDEVISKALKEAGIDIQDYDFIKNNVTCITAEGDEFIHYYLHYGLENEKRLLSVERLPSITFEEDGSLINKTVKVNVSSRYY